MRGLDETFAGDPEAVREFAAEVAEELK